MNGSLQTNTGLKNEDYIAYLQYLFPKSSIVVKYMFRSLVNKP